MKPLFKISFLFLLSIQVFSQSKVEIVAPAGNEYTNINQNGRTIIPNGRILTPLGKKITTAPHPYGLILSPDGNTVVTANSGTKPFSISIIRNILSENPQIQQVPEGAQNNEGVLEACFMGLAISPDNQTIYVAGGQSNQIFIYDLTTGAKKGSINCKMKGFYDGYIGDMVLAKDGNTLFAVDQIGFRLIEIDVRAKKVVQNIPTGRYPFGICLTPDGQRICVANVGVFEYKNFTDLDPKNLKATAHQWPSSKYGSKEMLEGDAKNGVPALGDPNVKEAFSVWSYEKNQKSEWQVKAKIKTGFLVGQMVEDFPAVGGSSPNSVVATNQYVFVSNGNNDCISVIDVQKDTVVSTIFLQPDARLGKLRGVIPFGVAVSPDQNRLYVAEAGINAVAVIDIPTLKVIGHLPVGWFPSKLKVSNDGKKLIVANAKGFGSGPNAGSKFTLGKEGSYIGGLMKGFVSVIDIPTDDEIRASTKTVVDNNFKFLTLSETNSSKAMKEIKHIVFISKENRTYDEVFGQMENGVGNAQLARFGLNANVTNRNKTKKVDNVNVMPNHISLAKRFVMSDNFYCDADHSADGHRWMVNTYPNEWCETGTSAAYGGGRDLIDTSSAPGMKSFYGSAGSIYPEDYNEAGSMWEHLERNNISFFNFGFGVEMALAYSDSTMKHIGELYTVNYPLPAPLYDRSSKLFPTYNMAVPDQFRVDMFMKEFNEKWGKEAMPQLITLMLPNDHGSSERPNAGWPFTESYMADNDLAVGRVVEFLSRTKYWKNMLIVILEDDPQGGVDHVDAHRSPLVVISPWVKQNYVSHTHYSFGSVFKTFWQVLGIKNLNHFDAGATSLVDMFTDKPNFTPYNAINADKRIFDPQKALDPFDEKFDWKAFAASEELDRTETMQKRRAEEDDKVREKAKMKKGKGKRK